MRLLPLRVVVRLFRALMLRFATVGAGFGSPAFGARPSAAGSAATRRL